jgi:nucleoside-diphosphate-sugar epimerase
LPTGVECARDPCAVEAARQSGSPLIFGSSVRCMGQREGAFSEDDPIANPSRPYVATKIAGEPPARRSATSTEDGRVPAVLHVRRTPEARSRHSVCPSITRAGPSDFGDGTTRRDYTYIDDITWASSRYEP